MVRDLGLAALLGPGLVLGSALALDDAGVLHLGGLMSRVLAVLAVVVAMLVLAACRRVDEPPSRTGGRSGRRSRAS